MSRKLIFVVDDDSLSRDFLTEATRGMGHEVQAFENGALALQATERRVPDLVLSDVRMPVMDGIQLTRNLQERFPGLPVVLVTAHASLETALDALRLGAVDFLLKPCTPDNLELVVGRVLRTGQLERENAYLRNEVQGAKPETIIAQSPPMVQLLRTAARVARSRGTVLISGESGTGKEKVAQYVHQASPRADHPFVRVNCAALSESLLESELFGHEKGSFTGAFQSRVGRFELADGGTVLLDEIGDISPNMQAKLLRVLQEGEFERVGGTTTLQVDVRVIAATNRRLADEVAAGRFREDLYYRLHVLPLEVATLRERREDILPLARHFAQLFARQNGSPNPAFSVEAQERLLNWNWPGNVRELENVIHRAVILGRPGHIEEADLVFGPAGDGGSTARPSGQSLDLFHPECANALADHTMANIERVAILATLQSSGNNKTEAARRLGLTARTLSNKMKIWRQTGLVA
ncbi:MAG: sigma-54-dependent Fis family transcriptional regulator [Planctomycetes bacterium]|nr:sigma-54-dependent Fis family transcriptional regulator [Planctomycetota bacterium]MCB9909974.1 sigma-54-dependent Fis family transcriptional regulator [Planctomycetota bacterium]HPF12708.1 sigma-54 dependent transcriptional regulator [Planctomycetota bacterium]